MRDREWDHEIRWKDVKANSGLGSWKDPCQECEKLEIEEQKRRNIRREYRGWWEAFEIGGFMAQKGLWNIAKENLVEDIGALPTDNENSVEGTQSCARREFSQQSAARRCESRKSGNEGMEDTC